MKVKKSVTNKSTRFANKNEGISPMGVSIIMISCVFDSLRSEQTILFELERFVIKFS